MLPHIVSQGEVASDRQDVIENEGRCMPGHGRDQKTQCRRSPRRAIGSGGGFVWQPQARWQLWLQNNRTEIGSVLSGTF